MDKSSIETNVIYNEDCRVTMARMPDGLLDLTVTSPPYDNLRDYKGYSFDFESIAKELYRVTKEGGVVVWVVGDATVNGSESGTSFKQALFFKEVGFNLHDTMIYAKNNPIPLTHNRYEQQFEYMFVLTKGKIGTFNPIKEKTKSAGKLYSWDVTNDYGTNSAKRARDEIVKVKEHRSKMNIWFYSIGNSKITNSAPFPEQLAIDHIRSWSNKGDLVYDPFMGSGTTAIASLKHDRQYIGSEISKEYCDIINQRIDQETRQVRLF